MESVDKTHFDMIVRLGVQTQGWQDVPVIGHTLCAMQYLDPDTNTLMAVATYAKPNEPNVKVIPSYRVRVHGS